MDLCHAAFGLQRVCVCVLQEEMHEKWRDGREAPETRCDLKKKKKAEMA